MNSDREGRAPGEPPNGDFVAYLEDLERRQLAAMGRAQALAHAVPSEGAPIATAQPLSRDAASAPVQRLRASRAALPLSTGSLLMLIVGALALANALLGEGGIVALAVAVALLWRPVRRLMAAVRARARSAPRPQDALAAASAKPKSNR